MEGNLPSLKGFHLRGSLLFDEAAGQATGITNMIMLRSPSAGFSIALVKPIRLSKHALDYARKRGFTVAEVEETIRTSSWCTAELGRLDCRKDLVYSKEWNGRLYATKQVRPVFVEEAEEIVVITVYTYYFNQT